MITAGVDVGAATTKAVVVKDGQVCSHVIISTGDDVSVAAETVFSKALEASGISRNELSFVVSTGYGRHSVSFADKAITEIICHARGAKYLIPTVGSIIDIGGQDSKVISVRADGGVSDFVMNDKCAAGTGRFLEVMARVLHLDIQEMGPIALMSSDPCRISSTCTIFAETEMVSLRAQGRKREDLVAGIIKAVSSRVAIMGKRLGFGEQVVFTGGVAKNIGVKSALEEDIGFNIMVPPEPQIAGALGAALLAQTEAEKLDRPK